MSGQQRRPESPNRFGQSGTFPSSGSLAELSSSRGDRSSYGSSSSLQRMASGRNNTEPSQARSSSPGYSASPSRNGRSASPNNGVSGANLSPRSSPRLTGASPRLSGSLSLKNNMLLELVCIVVGKPAVSPPFTVSVFPDVSVGTFRELVAARLEASLRSRGLRHVDLDLFRADHGPLTSDNAKLSSLAVTGHAFTPTEIRSVLPVTLITYNPSVLMSEFFSAGQTFSSLHGNTVSAVDIVVTVRRNAYNEARLSASMNKPRFPSSPNGMLLDRPATTGRIMRQLGPSSPGGLTGQRPLTRPLSHSSLLARNPPPMSEIAEEEEEAMSIHLGRKRSVSASSIGSVPRRSLDLEFSVPSGGRKSRDTSEVTAATAASASLKKRSKSAESHKSCPEVFERPSRDWDGDREMDEEAAQHPFVPSVEANNSRPVTPTRVSFPFNPFAGFARSASRGSTTDTAATTVAEIPTSGSVSGDEIEKDIPARPDSSTSTASAGAVTLARQSTPVPVKEGDEVIPMERGVSKSGSFMTTKRGKGDSTKGSDSGGEIQTLSHKRTSTLLGGGRSAKAVSKSFLAANEEVPGDEDTQKRNRRRRICVIVGVAVAFLLAGLGITLFFVWPRVPVVMVTSATGRSTDFEPVAGTSGKVGGATFIAQFKNQVVLEVASASFVGMNVRSVTFSGVMSRRNGTRNPEGTFTGTFDGSSLPARRSVNVTVPTLFTYSTFSRVNITGDQVATYPQILNAVCTLVDPGSSRLVLDYEVSFNVPAFSWAGFNPKIAGTTSIPC